MALIDIAIVGILTLSALIGLFRGFIKEILSLTSWLLALWVAYTFVELGAGYLEPYIQQQALRLVASFCILFVVALLIISMISYVLYRMFAVVGISGVDRSLGLLFGIVRGVVVISILIIFAGFMGFNTQLWWNESYLVDYFSLVNNFLISLLPPELASYVSATLK